MDTLTCQALSATIEVFESFLSFKNCGTGHGGFQAGNHCGGRGGGRRAVHGKHKRQRRQRKVRSAAHGALLKRHAMERKFKAEDHRTDRQQLRSFQSREHAAAPAHEHSKLRVTHSADRAKQRTEHRAANDQMLGKHRAEEAALLKEHRKNPGAKPGGKPGDAKPTKPGSSSNTPVKFGSEKEIEAWGQTHYHEWGKNLTSDERIVINHYVADGYRGMNADLRSGDITPRQAERIKTLDGALRKATTPEAVTVYRGISKPKDAGIDLASLKPGDTLHEKGFSSTSLSAKLARTQFGDGGVVLKVNVPKGTHGAYVSASKLLIDPSEREFLMPSGAGKYRVTSVKQHESGVHVVSVDLIP